MILDKIKDSELSNDCFTPYEVSKLTGIDCKVCAMVLKKYYNKGTIGGYFQGDYIMYYLKNEEQ